MTSFLQNLFQDKLQEDHRQAVYEFTVPSRFSSPSEDAITLGVFAPQAEFWKQLAMFVLLLIPIQCLCSVIIYQCIVKQRQKIQCDGRNAAITNYMGSYLIGWGILIPFACLVPYRILEFLDIRNKAIKLAASNVFNSVGFRCIEAMYDTTPSASIVESSIWNYMTYYSTGVSFYWESNNDNDNSNNSRKDPTTKSISPRKIISTQQLVEKLLYLCFLFHATSVLLSFLMQFPDFKPLPQDAVELDRYHVASFRHILDLIAPSHLVNGYLHILLVFLMFSLGFEGTAFSENIKGYDTVPIFRNPIFQSRTPTEFWTKRWNTMTHTTLKYGIFFPAQKYINKKLALFLTFLASGVYHDYVWSLVFFDANCVKKGSDCYRPMVGQLTAFFLFTGIFMLLERPILKFLKGVVNTSNVPTLVISTILVLIHVPVAHWYYGDFVMGGYFKDFGMGFWQIRQVS